MKKIGKMKVLLSVLLVMLCVVGVASVNDSVNVENTSFGDSFHYEPTFVEVKVGQTAHTSAVIPLGYGNLTFEDNPYCEITVSGNDIAVKGLQPTGNGDTTVIGTVTQVPIYARNYFSLTASLVVKVHK